MLKIMMLELAKQRIPLSLRTLATYVSHDCALSDKVDFEIVDLQIDGLSKADFLLDLALSSRVDLNKIIREYNPDVICVSVWLWNFSYVKTICQFIKKSFPNIKIISGGQGIFYPEEYLKDNTLIDIHCYEREGEESFTDLMNYFLGNIPIADVKGIFHRDLNTGSILKNAPMERKVVLDKLKDIYIKYPPKKLTHKGFPLYVVVEMFRGCVFKCSYCAWGTQIKNCFFKDLDSIINEMNSFPKDTHFEIGDSFVNTPQHIYVFSNLSKKFKYVSINVEHRINKHLTQEFMDSLDTFDQVLIDIGVQSFDTKVLKAIHRSNDLPALQEWSDAYKGSEKRLLSFHILMGLPYQTLEILKKDIETVSYLGTYMVFAVIALPGSEYWETSSYWGGVFEDDYPFSFLESDYISREEADHVKKTYGFIKEQGVESPSHLKDNLLSGDIP